MANDLLAIRKQCLLILEFTANKTLVDFLQDEMLRAAVERKLEIIGIAGVHIRDVDRDCFDQVGSLQYAIGLRNRLAHGYDDLIDDERIWNVATSSIQTLLAEVESLIDS